MNDNLYAWNGEANEWAEPYGFVPLVAIQHNDVGLPWGWSEYHSAHPKFREVDDVASKLSDQIRKMVDAGWLMSGVSNPKKEKARAELAEPTTTNPEGGREEIPIFYAPMGATATPLVAPLDIGASSNHIKDLLKNLEQDYPELALDIHNIQGDISGRALRINQQPVENKVNERRTNYDDALVHAQQMAIAIGGFRNYPGYDGFNLESYGAGELDHQIGERPVFAKDPLDDLETEKEFWETAKVAKDTGIPIIVFLEEHGWTDEQIAKVSNSEEYKARMAGLKQASMLSDGQTETGEEAENGETDTDATRDLIQ